MLNAVNLLKTIILPLLFLLGIWCVGAVYYTIGWYGWIKIAGTLIFATAETALFIFALRSGKILPVIDLIFLEMLVTWHFVALTPQDRFRQTRWQAPWSRRAEVVFDGTNAEIRNVRDFRYRTKDDYDVRYISVQIDMDQAKYLDIAVSHWDGLSGIAHTMLSFEFSGGRHLAFSMETRLPEGAEQGFLPGLYKQYELLPIIGTEDDLFKLRTNYRGEKLYLYRTNATPEQCRFILKALLEAVNRQLTDPQFYNSITRNCTSSLSPMLRWINPSFSGDIRLLFNGYSDELLYDLGYLARRDGEKFPELKQRRDVGAYLRSDPDYSRAIRRNLL